MTADELVKALDARLRTMATSTGWDAPRAFIQAKDPAGRIRVQFLAIQGSIGMSVRDAEGYLLWLEEGNVGTAIRWASTKGRKLS
jgi:hypothetical protein